MQILAILILLYTNAVKICNCDTLTGYTNSENVFSGKVVDIKESEASEASVIFRVDKFYKWNNKTIKKSKRITVYTTLNIFGFFFEKGKSYLVFQNITENDQLKINLCTLTTRIKPRCNLKKKSIGSPSLKEVKDHNWTNRSSSNLFKNWILSN